MWRVQPKAMTEPRQIAVVRSYDELLAVMRQRVAELGINYQILDDVTCFTDSYSTKVLGRGAITRSRDDTGKLKRGTQRGLSPQAFDSFVGALGFDLVAVENPERTEKLRVWLIKRETKPKLAARMLPIGRMRTATWLITSKKSPWLNKLRNDKVPPEKRQEIARHASKARWRKHRLAALKCPKLMEQVQLPPGGAHGDY